MLQRIAGAHEVTKTHVAEAYDASSFARSESMGLFLNIDGGSCGVRIYTLRYTQIPNTKTRLWPHRRGSTFKTSIRDAMRELTFCQCSIPFSFCVIEVPSKDESSIF